MSWHTPGPWSVGRSAIGNPTINSNGRWSYPTAKRICSCVIYPISGDAIAEARANAHLIAASPDLLTSTTDIMREYRHIMGDDTAEIAAAFATIARAQGSGE